MSDLVRREDVVEALYQAIRTNLENPFLDSTHLAIDSMTLAKAMANEIPSAEPERKKGKWIEDKTGYGFWICSACGFASEAFGANILYPFCPNCGAKLDWSGDE